MSRGEIRPGLLGTKRTALVMYGMLIVLPTLVLGLLHWRQLENDHQKMLADVPRSVESAAKRLTEAMHSRLHDVVHREEERPFFEYKPRYFPPDTIGADLAFVGSPLTKASAPPTILCWFSYVVDPGAASTWPVVLLGSREETAGAARLREDMLPAALEVREIEGTERWFPFLRVWRARADPRSEAIKLPVLAINLSDEQSLDCLRDDLPALRGLQEVVVELRVSEFVLHFYREQDGKPRVYATRTVTIPRNPELEKMPACFAGVGRGTTLVQGFFLDPDWLFKDLPATVAAQVLETSQEFVPVESAALRPDADAFTIRPIRLLRILAQEKDLNFGVMRIVANARDLEARFRTQTFRFVGMAAMLVLSLVTGLVLLLRSVNRDLEAARRTENFVAAVTHELRTPVAAIKLYGEMLEDGWVDDPEKLHEYYRRIVRETGRLETLVENVLEKSQLAQREVAPEPGDLNQAIESLAPSLLGLGLLTGGDGKKDLEFEYDDDLPLVMFIPEGVRSIVTNLVENARKYAPPKVVLQPEDSPVPSASAAAEPILVKTHLLAGSVVLDVLDRGPGIPHNERSRIFEAFYRVGNETTRTTRGTGLGLHLVALQAQAMGARVAVLDRKGGGTVFRVTFATAPAA
jgi:signal transduction histidine kinase